MPASLVKFRDMLAIRGEYRRAPFVKSRSRQRRDHECRLRRTETRRLCV